MNAYEAIAAIGTCTYVAGGVHKLADGRLHMHLHPDGMDGYTADFIIRQDGEVHVVQQGEVIP